MRAPHPLAVVVLQLLCGDPLTQDDRRAIALALLRLWRRAHRK